MEPFERKHNPYLEKRQQTGPVKIDSFAKESLNQRLARKGTILFGSMWTFYVFVIYGALGAFFVAQQVTLLYWSNWIQLWSLPLLMVGGIVLGKASDKRAEQTYEDASAVLHEAHQIQEHLDHQDQKINQLVKDLTSALETIEKLENHLIQ